MKNKSIAGNIQEELKQISKMQENTPWILSMITNTCTGVRTVFCC